MPKGDKYIALKTYLESCGLDEITMTFAQIAEIVGGMPKSAYDYTAPWYDGHGGLLAQCWLNAGYTSSAVVRGKQVTFTRLGVAPAKEIIHENRSTRTFATNSSWDIKALKNLSVFNDDDLLSASLDKTSKEYRQHDPGWYLYRMIINYAGNKISSDFIQLVYVTLCAWNMNSRGAKLSEYDVFEKSIFSHGELIQQLEGYEIHSFSNNTDIQHHLKELFFNLNLVASGKPVLVTASKTFHFFLPNLVVPIDRKYTLSFFNGNTNVNPNVESQFRMFLNIQKEFSVFSATHNLGKYKDERWNLTVPKVIDNMIIGFMKL